MSDDVVQIVVDEVGFRSDDGRFAVVRGTREPSGEKVVAVGDLGSVATGESLRLAGRFEEHAQYGRRFAVTSFTPVVPTSAAGVARYLGSGLVPGIGPGLAERLVAKFGARTLDVIATQSARLREVPGIGARRAGAIAEAVRSRRDEAEAMSFLHALGLGPALARRVLRRYGTDAARLLREDPYLVAEELHGIGFKTADRIGRTAGIAADDPRRAAGAVLHVLARASDDGHTYVDRETLDRDIAALDVPAALVPAAIRSLGTREMIVVEGDAIFLPALQRAEERLARHLAELARRPDTTSKSSAPTPLDETSEAAMALSAGQRHAVEVSLQRGLVVLTGGPGTGKTTTVRAIVRAHEARSHRVVLAAPTGRAAKRLSEATGRDARTVHRLLEWSPQTATFLRGVADPLDADLVLVDEASMLDLPLADALVAALPARATLVLVGDVDQLPPVGAGHVLRELLTSEVAAVVRLTEIFRQAQRSRIVQGAHAVLRGESPTATPTGERGEGDLFVVRAIEPEAILAKVVETVRRIERSYGLDPKRDVQVLVPMRKGPVGTERLNEVLQAALNPQPGRSGMRAGDKVMQLRNDYERDVFNGDVGEVVRVAAGVTTVRIDGRDVAYSVQDLEELTLAYACTIHKAQGSEMAAVVIVLHAGHHVLLDRALLYTAITRAKQLVVIVGDPRAIARAAHRADAHRARSKLAERLKRSV